MSCITRLGSDFHANKLPTPAPNFFIVINVSITTHWHTSSFNKEFEIHAWTKKQAYEIAKQFCSAYNVDDAPEGSNASVRTSVVLIDDI